MQKSAEAEVIERIIRMRAEGKEMEIIIWLDDLLGIEDDSH